MRKIFLFLIPLFIAIVIVAVFAFVLNNDPGKGALQVTANPKSNVYLNGKLIGQTPLCKCELPDMLKAGDYTVRVVPEEGSFSPFEEKITISKSVLTVVDRTFDQKGGSEGSIISLSPVSDKKKMELLVISFPQEVSIDVDSNKSGLTPILLSNLTESDHEIKLTKEGYKEKMVRIRTVAGYKVTVLAFLGVSDNIVNSPTPSLSPSPSISPIPSISVVKVEILDTPTGFLRVRQNGSLDSSEIARVKPGETFDLVEEKEGWVSIKLADGKIGWVSVQYIKKL